MTQEVEDVVELMHRIQLRLPAKDAVRTSLLSKSWLRAWSTIPHLRFDARRGKSMKLEDVDRTLIRYIRDNIPISSFDLKIEVKNQESASHVEKWIAPVTTKTCLRKFSLSIFLLGASFTLPDEIFSGGNVTRLRVSSPYRLVYTMNPVINCVSLRELYLDGVHITEMTLHDILSSCTLLENIELLRCCKGFKTIKVQNLAHLYELRIWLKEDDEWLHDTALEISDVPNLDMFSYNLDVWGPQMSIIPFSAHSMPLGSNVTELKLGGVIHDNECLNKINSVFPFLESLELRLKSWRLESFHFTCASMKKLSLEKYPNSLTDVQVHAPKLRDFHLAGDTFPSLSFPVSSSLKKITVSLGPQRHLDANFFLRMREALTFSRNFDLHIITQPPFNIDIDDLKTRLVLPPATNMKDLWFETRGDDGVWDRSLFFDAFFEICHPKNVFAQSDHKFGHNNHFCRLMLREVLDKKTTTATETAYWPDNLKHVKIRKKRGQKWKTLTTSHRSFLDGSAPGVSMYFKLEWH